MTEWSVSHETKKHIVTKDVVGLLLGEAVSNKKNIVAKDLVGLLLGEVVSTKKTNTSLQRMWLAYKEEIQ